jgi:hypothetical protein
VGRRRQLLWVRHHGRLSPAEMQVRHHEESGSLQQTPLRVAVEMMSFVGVRHVKWPPAAVAALIETTCRQDRTKLVEAGPGSHGHHCCHTFWMSWCNSCAKSPGLGASGILSAGPPEVQAHFAEWEDTRNAGPCDQA